LTKDLPKANYVSNRGDSGSLTGIQPAISNKKLIQSHQGQLRLQSEPVIPNSRQLPSIYQMKDPKYIGAGAMSEPSSEISTIKTTLDPVKPMNRRSK
jgi:hypothetical protein